MEVLYPHCAGLDVHKDTVVACLRHMATGSVEREVRTFNTFALHTRNPPPPIDERSRSAQSIPWCCSGTNPQLCDGGGKVRNRRILPTAIDLGERLLT